MLTATALGAEKAKTCCPMKRTLMKKPSLNDVIVHHEPGFSRTNTGKVVQLLAMQFIYETDAGQTRFCLFKEDWKLIEKG